MEMSMTCGIKGEGFSKGNPVHRVRARCNVPRSSLVGRGIAKLRDAIPSLHCCKNHILVSSIRADDY